MKKAFFILAAVLFLVQSFAWWKIGETSGFIKKGGGVITVNEAFQVTDENGKKALLMPGPYVRVKNFSSTASIDTRPGDFKKMDVICRNKGFTVWVPLALSALLVFVGVKLGQKGSSNLGLK